MLGLRLLGNFVRSAFERKYGPELLTNPQFLNSTGWNFPSGYTAVGGQLVISGTQTATLYQSALLTAGVTYRYAIKIDEVTTVGQGVKLYAGGSGASSGPITAPGVYYFNITSINQPVELDARNGFVGKIDYVSVKRIL